jgi:type II secretory pathway component PulK
MIDRRGVALMLVLWIVVVLAGVGVAVTTAARRTTSVTVNARARAAARYAAESGVEAQLALLERRLAAAPVGASRGPLLNQLVREGEIGAGPEVLGEARFQVALVDASARLDLNLAGEEALATLFAQLGGADGGRTAARAVQRWLGAEGARDGAVRGAGPTRRRLFASLDDLARVPGVPPELARAAAPVLTVDGDGRVNRVLAPPVVRAAARGELTDAPTRLLLVSRGWLVGSPLTHEIQAVYAVDGERLAFVRWRERDL